MKIVSYLVTLLLAELLDASLGEVSRALSHWGVGTRELLKK